MNSSNSYFVIVRRNEILMFVKSSKKNLESEGRDYRKTKHTLALKHLIKAKKANQKSLVYFPTVRLLIDFYQFIVQNEPNIAEVTGRYFGGLQKEEKDEVLYQYKSGKIQF